MENLHHKNPWWLFAPFLGVYLIMIYVLNSATPIILMGDEPRYLQYAQNLLNGYFSPKGTVDLWSGPGYPLLLAPFLKIGFNTIGLRLINAFLQYASIVYLYKTLLLWVRPKKAFFFTIAWALYYIAFKEMLFVYTEPLTCLLITAIAFQLSKGINSTKSILLTGFLLGYLALVKIMFGYVIAFCFIILLCVYLLKKQNIHLRFAFVFLIAIITTIPYLSYTHQLSGRYFYWGNSGGMSLYWMSTPISTEYGDWNDAQFRAYCDYDSTMPCNATYFAKGHQADYDQIYKLDGVARDDAFKQKAIQNIKSHPTKYAKNILANMGRLFFGLPNSYNIIRMQHFWRIIPNAFVFCITVLSFLLSFYNFKKLPTFFHIILLLLITYIGATLLVSAQQRQLYVVLPLILILFAWLSEQLIQFRFRLIN